MKRILILLLATLLLCSCATPPEVDHPSEGIIPETEAGNTEGLDVSDMERFSGSPDEIAFPLWLLKKSLEATPGENALLSPLSIRMALAMALNGADGETRTEMEALLGKDTAALNEAMGNYLNDLPDSEEAKLTLANSIWMRDSKKLTVLQEYLNLCREYYDAEVRNVPFDSSTLAEINDWVKTHTDGKIEKILNDIDPDAMLYLLNALSFEAKWETPFKEYQIAEEDFFPAVIEQVQTVEMMRSTEWVYLENDNATGFIKPYAGGRFSFAAILPNEGTDFASFVDQLTPESLQTLLDGARSAEVHIKLPKFTGEYQIEMSGILKTLGISTAFDKNSADFTKMGKYEYDEKLYIGRVLHKTFISVDDQGTEAAGVTGIEMVATSSANPNTPVEYYTVFLDHPFVYMILDTETGTPIFIGAVQSIPQN